MEKNVYQEFLLGRREANEMYISSGRTTYVPFPLSNININIMNIGRY